MLLCSKYDSVTPRSLWLLQGVSSTPISMGGKSKKSFYCVVAPPGCVSATTGIYSCWEDACANGAQGVSGVLQCGFYTRAEAEVYIAALVPAERDPESVGKREGIANAQAHARRGHRTDPTRQEPSIEHPSRDDDRGRGGDRGSPQGRDRRDRDDSRDRRRRRHSPSSEDDRRDRRRDRRRSRSRSDSR